MFRIFHREAPLGAADGFASRDLTEDELDLIAGGLPAATFEDHGPDRQNHPDSLPARSDPADRSNLWL